MPLGLVAGYHLAESSLTTCLQDDFDDDREQPFGSFSLESFQSPASSSLPQVSPAAKPFPQPPSQDEKEARVRRLEAAFGVKTSGASSDAITPHNNERHSHADDDELNDAADHANTVHDDDDDAMWAMLDEQVQAESNESFDETMQAMEAAADEANLMAEQQQAAADLDDVVITNEICSLPNSLASKAQARDRVLQSPISKSRRIKPPSAVLKISSTMNSPPMQRPPASPRCIR